MESAQIRAKFPDRVPVIMHRQTSTRNSLKELDKTRYLLPADLTMGQFAYVIRKRLTLNQNSALFFFVMDRADKRKSVLVPNSYLISMVDRDHKNIDDGLLHITYSSEDTFG